MSRIMEIHVAEEARHISFAHEFIKLHGPNLGRINRFIVSMLFPIIMRVGADLIMIPPKAFRKEFGIPRKVIKDLYWRAPESRQRLQEMFADARMLAEQSRPDDAQLQAHVATLQDRRPTFALPQRAACRLPRELTAT